MLPQVYFSFLTQPLVLWNMHKLQPLSIFLSSTPTGVAKRETSAYDIAGH